MKIKRQLLSTTKMLTSFALVCTISACGGGGGTGSTPVYVAPPTTNPVAPTSSYYVPVLVGTYDPLVGIGTNGYISVIRARDINSDGVDEVVIGGRETMNFVDSNHENSVMSIFGWNNNPSKLSNETNTWFRSGDNVIVGTEPSIKFGNFTGRTDGQLDMFVAGGTDSPGVLAPSIIFKNNGDNTFTRIELAGSTGWAHGSDVGDINGDGIDDMVAVGYVDSPTTTTAMTVLGGTTPTVLTSNGFNSGDSTITSTGLKSGDSTTIGEFLGAGNGSYVLTTNSTVQPWFQRFDSVSNQWVDEPISVIDNNPISFDNGRHSIRIQALSVNNDGLQDFVMISRPDAGAGGWDGSTNKSYVEFFKNLGNGQFEKVAMFEKDQAVFYNIEVKDINNDGVDDVFLGATGDGSTVLLGNANNSDIVYAEAGTSMISDFEDDIGDPSAWEGAIGSVNIAKGPNGKSYLVGTSKTKIGNQQLNVYYSEITSTGVVTLESSIASLQQMWPQLNTTDAEEILSITGTNFANGTLIELQQAFAPIGQMMVATKDNGIVPLSGSISGVSFGSFDTLVAADMFDRNYNMNITAAIGNANSFWAQRNLTPVENNSAALSLIDNVISVGNFKFSNDLSSNTFGFAYSGAQVTKNFAMQFGSSTLNSNPWLNMSGSWGKVTKVSMAEISGVYSKDQFTARGGIMRATTKFDKGLVTDISPITAMWIDTEYAVDKRLTVGAGMFPKVISGSVTANLPTLYTSSNNTNYTSVSADVSSPTVGYLRANWNEQLSKKTNYNFAGLMSTTGDAMVKAGWEMNF